MSSTILDFSLKIMGGNMNSVELVKNICKERKIPISRLEQDLNPFKPLLSNPEFSIVFAKPAKNQYFFYVTHGNKMSLMTVFLKTIQHEMQHEFDTICPPPRS